MKKTFLILFAAGALVSNAQLPGSTLRFGLQYGIHHNNSFWDGGMDEASGRFRSNEFTGLAAAFTARYDVCDRVYFTASTGVYDWGFEYTLSRNYSFLNSTGDVPYAQVRLTSIELPFMVNVKSRLDCQNGRWIAGLGVSTILTGKRDHVEFADPNNEGNQKSGFSTTVNVPGGAQGYLRLSAGREFVTKKNGIMQVELVASLGRKTIAGATVNYVDEGKEYTHEFSNRGTYAGLRFCFYFGRLNREFPSKK